MTLTASQKKILESLASAPAFAMTGKFPKGLNGTALTSLVKSGLVVREMGTADGPVASFRGREFPAPMFSITDAGRVALK